MFYVTCLYDLRNTGRDGHVLGDNEAKHWSDLHHDIQEHQSSARRHKPTRCYYPGSFKECKGGGLGPAQTEVTPRMSKHPYPKKLREAFHYSDNLRRSQALSDLADAIDTLGRALDSACDRLGDDEWYKVVDLIPWHESVSSDAIRKSLAKE